MQIKRSIPLIAGLGLCFGIVALAQNADSGDQQNKRQVARIRQQQQKIERLEQQLSDAKSKLEALQREALGKPQNSLPPVAPKVAYISWITGAHQGMQYGKRDGFRASDRLIVLERAKPQIDMLAPETHDRVAPLHPQVVVKGYCVIEQLYDKDMILFAPHNAGVRPEDEVYILNRDDSPYSFAAAQF